MKPTPANSKQSKGEPGSSALFGLKRWQYVAINVFLIFHILAIACWALPTSNTFVLTCRNAIRPYMVWSGLFQSWDMFSPVPKVTNAYVEAVVLYKDGSTSLWSFPRMDLLSATEKYSQERYRKFAEVLLDDRNSPLWPDVARYVARMPDICAHHPQKILLVVRWSDIVAHDDGTFTRSPWDAHVFYSYDVKPEDLQ
ncbi:MAG: hypothetical protein WB630_23910 [Candidatus Acidiferrales bacterium]